MKICTLIVILVIVLLNSESSAKKVEEVDWSSASSVLASMARSITTSQVLTINLTNAVILAGLKVIVIIAGIFGKFSFWTYPGLGGIPFHPFARSFQRSFTVSAESEPIIDEMDSLLVSSEDIRWSWVYMWSLNKRDFSCLNRMACENRDSAQVYSHAAHLMDSFLDKYRLPWIGYNPRYRAILDSVDEAIKLPLDTNCRTRYPCESAPFTRRQVKIKPKSDESKNQSSSKDKPKTKSKSTKSKATKSKK